MPVHKKIKIVYQQQGFSLIELMVTIAIASVLMMIAIPSFNQSTTNGRLTTNINGLFLALNLARSEAIKRNIPVTVRKSGAQWESGWTVFTDNTGVAGVNDGTDVLIRTYDAIPGGYTLRATYTNFITYQASGISTSGSFVLCQNGTSSAPLANTSKVINVNSVGRAGMGGDSDNNGVPDIDNGTEITSCTTSPFTS
jgi:type IV fimbrial biogenesis protein FimT